MQLSCGSQAVGAFEMAVQRGMSVRGRRRQVGEDKTPHIERPSYLGQINPARVRSSPDRLAEQGAESSEQRPVWGAAGEGWSEYGWCKVKSRC